MLIGVDIGGTNTVIGLVDRSGRSVLDRMSVATASLGSGDALPAGLARMIEGFAAKNGLSPAAIDAIGIGTPGVVDPERGISVNAVNLGYLDYPMAERVAEKTGRPVYLDNDVRMYGLGEALHGAGRGHRHVLCLTVGTGLAAAIVTDGRLHYGGSYAAGEIGHMPVPGIERDCVCGAYGCAEIYASATGMVRQANEAIASGRASSLAAIASAGGLSAAAISDAYDQGDGLAAEIFERTAVWIADSLVAAVHLLDPDVIVIGGGVAKSGDRLLAPLRKSLSSRVHPIYRERLVIVAATCGDDAGLLGSAWNAKTRAGMASPE